MSQVGFRKIIKELPEKEGGKGIHCWTIEATIWYITNEITLVYVKPHGNCGTCNILYYLTYHTILKWYTVY